MVVTKFLPMIFYMLAFSAQGDHGAATMELDLEPCINGGVSSSGVFPSQAMEEQVSAYIVWSPETGRPHVLYRAEGKEPGVAYRKK
jgi:hypothetical protein